MLVSAAQSYKRDKLIKGTGIFFITYGSVAFVLFLLFSVQPALEQFLGVTVVLAIFFAIITFSSWRFGFGQGLFAGWFLAFLVLFSQIIGKGYYTKEVVVQSTAFLLFAIFISIVHVAQKQKEQKLTQWEKHFKALVNKNPYPLVLNDGAGNIGYASKMIKGMVGFEPKELIGKNLTEFVFAQDRNQFKVFVKAIVQNGGNSKTIELRMKQKSGSWLWVRADAVSLLHDEAVKGIIISFQDISGQKLVDTQRIRSLEREKKARSVAVAAVRARDEFLSIASHELKTPLTTIIVKLQTTLRSILSQSLANFSGERLVSSLTVAEEQSQRLAKLIQDLLNVSLISTGRMKLELKKADLRDIVTTLLAHFDEQLKTAKCKLSLVADSPIVGLWDQVRIEQAVSNLLTNAIHYGGGKPIEVRAQKNGKFALLSVTDHGIGIKPGHHKIIFERFKRVITHREQFKGLGIGLFIVKQIALAHGGNIEVVSSPQKGATFILKLPIRKT